jgi:integrase
VKPTGRHPDKALSPAFVRNAKGPGRHADGNGLYLEIEPSGSRRWTLRLLVRGRRRDMGLGSTSLVGLAEARDLAVQYRKIARAGGDPIEQRRQSQVVVPSFAEVAAAMHKDHAAGWDNAKHRQQWMNTLRDYADPIIGAKPVNLIDSADVLQVLMPIWLAKPETAKRVRQRLRAVLNYARAKGYRSGENPVDGIATALPKQPARNGHFAALSYDDLPAFIQALRAADAGASARLAFEFMILTATRTSETLNARWGEFDLEAAAWTIPGERMKAGKDHRVPLAPRALEILAEAKKLSDGGEFVFPGRGGGKPLSNMAFLMTLRRMGRDDITAHGFRSAFADWVSERTSTPADIREMALAHAIRNKVEAAYRRGDLFDKRRHLMSLWENFATATPGAVVQLRPAR